MIRIAIVGFAALALLAANKFPEGAHSVLAILIGLSLLAWWFPSLKPEAFPEPLPRSPFPKYRIAMAVSAFVAAIACYKVPTPYMVSFWLLGLTVVLFPAKTALSTVYRRLRSREMVVPILLLIGSLILNCARLDILPYPIHGDEGELLERTRELTYSNDLLKHSTWWGFPKFLFTVFWTGSLITDEWWSNRLSGALLGVMCNLAFYATARRFVSANHAALWTVLFMTSASVLGVYRFGVETFHPMVLMALLIYAMFGRGPGESTHRAIVVGTLLGLSLYVYPAARVLPAAWFICSCVRTASAPTGRRKTLARDTFYSSMFALLVGAPMLVSFASSPISAAPRYEYVTRFLEEFRQHGGAWMWWQTYLLSLGKTISSMYQTPTVDNGEFLYSAQGFFAPLVAACIIAGIFPSRCPERRELQRFALAVYLCSILMFSLLIRPGYHHHRFLAAFLGAAVIGVFGFSALCSSLRTSGTKVLVGIAVGVYAVCNLSLYADTSGKSRHWRAVAGTFQSRTLAELDLPGLKDRLHFVTGPFIGPSNGMFGILGFSRSCPVYTEDLFLSSFPDKFAPETHYVLVPFFRFHLLPIISERSVSRFAIESRYFMDERLGLKNSFMLVVLRPLG